MTVLVAFFGLFLIPDNPGQTKVFWLNKEERLIAVERMTDVKKLPPTTYSWKLLRSIFSSWLIYVFSLAYASVHSSKHPERILLYN